jgi:hypothetical protein
MIPKLEINFKAVEVLSQFKPKTEDAKTSK